MKRPSPPFSRIKTFLEKAKRHGYDAEKRPIKSNFYAGLDILRYPQKGSPTTSLWFWEDAWVGSNPFSGTITVWYRGQVCYQNHFWGYVVSDEDAEQVYAFLRWARRQTWKNKSVRQVLGNQKFRGYRYMASSNNVSRAFVSSQKNENITHHGRIVCEVFKIKGVVQ